MPLKDSLAFATILAFWLVWLASHEKLKAFFDIAFKKND